MRNSGVARAFFGETASNIGAAEPDLGAKVCAFLRKAHPDKTAANVAAETGIPASTVEKWLCGVSDPRSIHFVRLYCRYGPEFLVAVTKNPPAWLTAAGDAAERAQLEAERDRIEARLARCPA